MASSCNVINEIIGHVLVVQVKGMGMDSPELLLLVENCPRGAETLVTRVIHILTDKGINTFPCSLHLSAMYTIEEDF